MHANNAVGYLRVSLLSDCNLNCFYCRPSGEHKAMDSNPHRFDRFKASIELLCGMGIRKVRFTGGEPTLYKRLVDLIAFTKSLDNTVHTALTSNGLLLGKLAEGLTKAGLDSVNISLDTLDRRKFRSITSVEGLDKVMAGIETSLKHIPVVKLNCVLIRGVNDNEVGAMVEFANRLGVSIRFIEYMPSRSTSPDDGRYISGDEIKARLSHTFSQVKTPPASAAKYYRSPDLDIPVGFINPVSHPFCADCNRVRLASDGRLYGCLYSGHSINLFETLEKRFDEARDEIAKLAASKNQIGCSQVDELSENLPSFVSIGG